MPKTVVGLFTDEREAQRAVRALLESGVAREDIGVTSNDHTADGARAGATGAGEGWGDKIANFFGSLFGADDERSGYYSEAVRGGGTVITVDADTDELAARAAAILDEHGMVEVNERGTQNVYAIRVQGFRAVQEFIDSFWDVALAQLEDLARR